MSYCLKLSCIGLLAWFALPNSSTIFNSEKYPGFVVDVTLSTEAEKKLVASKESVIVTAYFSGSIPLPLNEFKGPGDLGEIDVEIQPGKSAIFNQILLKPYKNKPIDQSNPQLLINVGSGRRSSPNNLLLCDIYEGDLKSVQGTHIPIACKLIGEHTQGDS